MNFKPHKDMIHTVAACNRKNVVIRQRYGRVCKLSGLGLGVPTISTEQHPSSEILVYTRRHAKEYRDKSLKNRRLYHNLI